MKYNLLSSNSTALCCSYPKFTQGSELLPMAKMLCLLFPLLGTRFPHLCLTLLILKISAQMIFFFFLANLSSFKCGLNIHLMSSHDESPSISLQYLVTAFFLLCIPHWTVGSERAGVGFLLHMVSPARLSKLGTIGCSVILTELSWIEWNT